MDELEYPPPLRCLIFCDLIRKDAERLSNLFEAENCEKPIVYKMKFRCKDSKFKFELKYEKDLPSDFQPEQVFIEWKQKIKNKKAYFYCKRSNYWIFSKTNVKKEIAMNLFKKLSPKPQNEAVPKSIITKL